MKYCTSLLCTFFRFLASIQYSKHEGRLAYFITYQVYDLGPSGDCDANALWVVETEPGVAFVGDLVFNGMHSYVADDHLIEHELVPLTQYAGLAILPWSPLVGGFLSGKHT
ncbi:hypothetical protein KSC_091820 [Ktedonobacter sp. SOSP1-52]|uniref:hypothetical protein n=1 Tax=Ktedonobacter sp. SOSP1-52 TaxID=2778366 RepID=UPI001915A78D|nr:hypothetical protein [Ktedonobacter sp. SOSP1-52]GHO70290.1 hypothetical protein KSC_091820 [Ktedonobacter sp. SOSP1-52]